MAMITLIGNFALFTIVQFQTGSHDHGVLMQLGQNAAVVNDVRNTDTEFCGFGPGNL